MQSLSNSSSPDRWELVIEEEVIDLPCAPVHQNPAPLILKITQARWRRFVLRLLVRRHGAYLMLLAKGWRKAK